MALEAERQCRRRGSLLFTHSSRTRFAGRLNSGVRRDAVLCSPVLTGSIRSKSESSCESLHEIVVFNFNLLNDLHLPFDCWWATSRCNHLGDRLKVCESSKVRFRYGPDDEPYGRPCKWPPQVDRLDFPRRSVAALGRKLSSPVATWSRFDLSRICQIPSDALRRRAPAMTRAMPRPHEGQRVPTEAKPRTRAHTRQAHDPFRRRVARTRRVPGSRRTTSGLLPSRPR